jgi:hypothetical protein
VRSGRLTPDGLMNNRNNISTKDPKICEWIHLSSCRRIQKESEVSLALRFSGGTRGRFHNARNFVGALRFQCGWMERSNPRPLYLCGRKGTYLSGVASSSKSAGNPPKRAIALTTTENRPCDLWKPFSRSAGVTVCGIKQWRIEGSGGSADGMQNISEAYVFVLMVGSLKGSKDQKQWGCTWADTLKRIVGGDRFFPHDPSVHRVLAFAL